MIKRIRLRNWRSHEDTELEFGKGTNLLVGVMGAGKSAVLDGISFALFGRFPGQRGVKLADVVMSRPTQKEQAEVELEFEWGGKNYSVKRTVRRKGAPEAELRVDGKLVMSDPEKVTELIEDALKIDYDVFCRAIYAEQNRIDYFLLLNPRDRKRQIDELLGIDGFGNARANLTTVINRLAQMHGEKEARLREMNPGELERKTGEARKAAEEAGRRRKDAAGALAKARTAASDAGKELGDLERQKREFDSEKERKGKLEGMLEGLDAEAKEREAACAGKPSLDTLEAELAKLSESLKSAEEERRKADAGISAVSREAGELGALMREAQRDSAKKAEFERRLRELEKGGNAAQAAERISALEQAITNARAKEAELARRIADLGVEIGALGKGGQNCPVCESPLSEVKAGELLAKKRTQLEEAQAGVGAARKEWNFAKAEKERLSPLRSEMESCLQKISELGAALEAGKGTQERLAPVQGKMKELEERRAMMEREASNFTKRAEAFRQDEAAWRELERVRKRGAEAKEGIVRSSTRLASLKFNEQLYSGKRNAAEAARTSAAKLEGDARVLEAEEKAAAERLALAESAIREAGKVKAEAAAVSEVGERMGKVQTAVSETQALLRTELMEAINETMGELWPAVYPYKDYTGARLMPSEEDYSLELRAADRWLPVEGIASGGERACAALALRIAFAMVLVPNLKWLVLDEPTHNLDEEGIRALVEVLRERLPEIVEQVFVITHDETLKDAANARLYRFDRSKGQDEPTRAVALN